MISRVIAWIFLLQNVTFIQGSYWNSLQYLSEKLPGVELDEISEPVYRRMMTHEQQCGVRKSENRIVKGIKAPLEYWPWLVALGYRDGTKKPSFQCGGVLITPKIVLTAAHCVDQRTELYLVRMGTNDLTGFQGQDIEVEEAIVHAGYKEDSNENDIALIRLRSPAQMTSSVQLVCLPANDTVVPKDNRVWIAGWGATSYQGPASRDLMHLGLNILANNTCRKAYERFGTSAVMDDRVFCAAGEPGRDACQGDSGGPLMWENRGVVYVVGIISYGYKCAEPDFPGVYTSVTAFLPWINRQIQANP